MSAILDKIGSIHSTCLVDGMKVLQQVLLNCEQMLKDRNCKNIEKTSSILDCMDENKEVITGRGEKSINIYFYNEERIGVKFLRNILETTNVEKIIIISLEGPTTFTRKESESHNVQFFLFKELFVNITKHEVCPRHELWTEVIPWSNEELPKIFVFDPIVQYYDFPIGSVIRIKRVFGLNEPTYYYRVVTAC